jgi:hypothetical protein
MKILRILHRITNSNKYPIVTDLIVDVNQLLNMYNTHDYKFISKFSESPVWVVSNTYKYSDKVFKVYKNT